jgi:polysaccharide pyruvyl transferase WcaK-like protein
MARAFYAGAEADPVVPDLAYAVPLPPASPPNPSGRPLEVGIAPIAEGDPRLWPTPDPARYARHLAGLAAFAREILASGATVRLFATDGPDHAAASRLHELILQGAPTAGRLVLEPTGTLPALLELLGEVDLVVAARLHAVLLAHVQGRPALALSYERKVATLMKEVGHEEFCLPIGDFEPVRAKELLDRLTHRREELSRGLRADAGRRREQVEAQYDRVFGPRAAAETGDGRG